LLENPPPLPPNAKTSHRRGRRENQKIRQDHRIKSEKPGTGSKEMTNLPPFDRLRVTGFICVYLWLIAFDFSVCYNDPSLPGISVFGNHIEP